MTLPLPPAADLYLRLRRLGTAGAVLHVGAHPDDEDAGLVAYLARGRAARTVYWSATRGEGGQNRIGRERGEALGLVRTWEAAAARQVDGGDNLYGPFYDFGFARTAEEALAAWGRSDLVAEIVRAIRLVQPDVVVSRWSGGEADGHGQHRAVGLVTSEAFERAGDPASCADDGLPPWQPLKLYQCVEGDWQPGEDRRGGGRAAELEREGLLRLDLGGYDPGAARTYRELACLAQNCHRTQAMTLLPARGPFYSYYRLLRSAVPVDLPEEDLFAGTDATLAGVAGRGGPLAHDLHSLLAAAAGHAAAAVAAYRPDAPAAAVDPLFAGLDALRGAVKLVAAGGAAPTPEPKALAAFLDRRLHDFEEVIAACLGIHLTCEPDRPRVTPGSDVEVTTRLWNLGRGRAQAVETGLKAPEGWVVRRLKTSTEEAGGAVATTVDAVEVPLSAHPSAPHWLMGPRTGARYPSPADPPTGDAFDPPPLAAVCVVEVGGRRLRLRADALRDEPAVGGIVGWPLSVLPPVSLRPRRRLQVLPAGEGPRRLRVDVEVRHLAGPSAGGKVLLDTPAGWQVHPSAAELFLEGELDARTVRFDVDLPDDAGEGRHVLSLSYAGEDGSGSTAMVDAVQAPDPVPGCPPQVTVVAPAVVCVQTVAADFVRSLRYGVVRGSDDEVVEALEGFGLDLTELTDEELAYADLGSFDTVVVGPNAYLAREAVRRAAGRLLDYVAAGGTLVVHYQAYGYQHLQAAPYPFRFSQPHDRVTRPDAPVELLEPDHPVLAVPNRIDTRDFAGWLHDRGKYFFGEWDPRYVPLLSSADPGEPSQRGGLLVASYGHGTFAYTAYSLHHQVAAGVPGAVRLLANLLGLAEARIRERMRLARRADLLAPMTDAQLHQVARAMTERWYADGETLCREGDRGDELFIVTSGEVEVVKNTAAGDDVVYLARPGEAIGELAVLADIPRAATLRARGDVRVLAMSGADFRPLLTAHPEMAQEVLRTLALRLAGSDGAP